VVVFVRPGVQGVQLPQQPPATATGTHRAQPDRLAHAHDHRLHTLQLRQQLIHIGTVPPTPVLADCLHDCFRIGRRKVPVASGVTDKSRCRDDSWTLQRSMHEREVRPAEFVGEKAVDSLCVGEYDSIGLPIVETYRWPTVRPVG
jgi:hypothetical protein